MRPDQILTPIVVSYSTWGMGRSMLRPYDNTNHNQRERSVPGGTMVASRSGPVEIMPSST